MAVATRGGARPSADRLRRHVTAWSGQSAATLRWLDRHAESLATGARPESAPELTLAQLVIAQSRLSHAVEEPTRERPRPFADYASSGFSAGDGQLRDDLAEGASVADLLRQLRPAVTELTDRLSRPQVPPVVRGKLGPIALGDLLRLGTVEWLVAAGDLSRTLPDAEPVGQDAAALATGVRAMADLLTERHPGRTIEVRIPPYAAVQIGLDAEDGPTHTRGTPPNVVETDPETFLRMAGGRESFGVARAAGRVRASGTRSDLSVTFPLL